MELTSSQESEIKSALSKHPDGMCFDDLFDATTVFVEQRELSGALHRMLQQSSVYKRGPLYLLSLVDEDPAPVARSATFAAIAAAPQQPVKVEPVSQPKPSAAAVVARAVAKAPPAPPKPVKPQNGNLRRNSVSGIAALVLYRYRNEGYSLPVARIRDCLPYRTSNIYASLTHLETLGYIKRHGTGRATVYNWSGKFNYPFSTISEDDTFLVRIPPKSERGSDLPLAVPTPPFAQVLQSTTCNSQTDSGAVSAPASQQTTQIGSDGSAVQAITPDDPGYSAIRVLDAKIALHQERVTFLKNLRATLLDALLPETSNL